MSQPAPKLTLSDINPLTIETKYAVRGKVPTRAYELQKQLEKDPSSLPFDKIIFSNIGNPQQLGQKPLTFYRRVTSLLQNPELIAKNPANYPQDVIDRASKFLKSAKSVGAYSNSQGVEVARQSVVDYISKRDGYPSDVNEIFLTNGASAAVEYVIETLCSGPKDGVLIPIPQYPLYSALLALLNCTPMPYYLLEEKGWSIDAESIEKVIKEYAAKGIKAKILVLINPGNPTGAILSREIIADILKIAAKYGIVVISDEVYQENVYQGKFVSARKVLKQLQEKSPEYYGNLSLTSLHSTSKGVSGECGQRAGYMDLVNFPKEIHLIFIKMVSINLCSVVTGQAVMEMMVNPPQKGDPSYELDQKEREDIHNSLLQRSQFLHETFNKMEGVNCQNAEGSMYLFPKLLLPKKAIELAKQQNIEPDELYCLQLLERTGICTVPGSGFLQLPGTYHLRTTFLPPGTEWIKSWEKFHKEFMDQYRD